MTTNATSELPGEDRAAGRIGDPAAHDRDPRTERSLAAILAAAFDLLIADGPGAVTHAQVAAAANVSRTTIYKHYPTRADLLRATIDVFGHHPIDTALTGDLRADLRALVGHVTSDLAAPDRRRAFAAMMERALYDTTVAEVRDGFVGEALALVRSILAAGTAAGTVRADTDTDLAIAGLLGTLLFRTLLTTEPVADGDVDRIVDHFISSIGPGVDRPARDGYGSATST